MLADTVLSKFVLDAELTVKNPRLRPTSEGVRIAREVAAAFGITRVHDVTPIGSLGVPVWAAVTPAASDLTQHLGRGLTAETAELSAILEAIERVAAENPTGSPIGLVDGSTSPGRLEWRGVQAAKSANVLSALELNTSELVSLPIEAVRSPSLVLPELGPRAWTTGLAAGYSRIEVLWHGLCEVVEREMLAAFELTTMYSDMPAHYPLRCNHMSSEAARLIEQIERQGMKALIFSTPVPTPESLQGAVCIVVDPSFPGAPEVLAFQGAAVSVDWQRASESALLEAVQAHTAMHLAARESFEGLSELDLPEPKWDIHSLLTEWDRDVACNHQVVQPKPTDASLSSVIIKTISELTDSRLTSVYYCDVALISDRARLHVGRVVCPGLSGPIGSSPWPMGTWAARQFVRAN